MELNDIVTIVSNYGMAFTVTIYFLFRDWKFNQSNIETMQALKAAVDSLKETMKMLHNGEM